MDTQKTPEKYYEKQIGHYTQQYKLQKSRHARLGWLRLIAIIIFIGGFYFYWGIWVLLAISFCSLGIFLWLVRLTSETQDKIKNLESLIQLQKEEIKIMGGQYSHRYDGSVFLPLFEEIGNDLDFFGPGSLYQFINRTNTEQGQNVMAKSLTGKSSLDDILAKQAAIQELSSKTEWRHQLQAITTQEGFTIDMENRLINWIKASSGKFSRAFWQILRWLIPSFSFIITGLYLANLIPEKFFNILIILTLAFVYSFYKKFTRSYNQLQKLAGPLQAVSKAFSCIENGTFQSPFLITLQKNLLQDQKSSERIAELRKILQRFDYRLNPVVHLPLSVYLFWDLQQVLALEKWKYHQSGVLGTWFETLGQFEMLASFGTLSFNKPNWSVPEINNDWFRFEANRLGHPLIREEKMISNDISFFQNPEIILLTGSNMAGKSTFLRTVGANIVLAMAGSPVCSPFLRLPVSQVICSMRITDNLQEETSTFLAELKKIKRIVEAVGKGERVFVLIDEMLRGTNAIDRHAGSVALIRQLIKQNAVAIIASHDLALTELEKEFPGIIRNYHFDSTIINEEIVFDYLLKEGVCRSNNATLLMKKVGIKI